MVNTVQMSCQEKGHFTSTLYTISLDNLAIILFSYSKVFRKKHFINFFKNQTLILLIEIRTLFLCFVSKLIMGRNIDFRSLLSIIIIRICIFKDT